MIFGTIFYCSVTKSVLRIDELKLGKYFISWTLKDFFNCTSALYERRIRIRLPIVWQRVSLFKVFGCFYVTSVMTTDRVIDAGK